MKKNINDKLNSAFDVFKRNQSVNYPELLVKFMENETVNQYQIQLAEYLLNIWVGEYMDMPQITKVTYNQILPKFLKKLFQIYILRQKGSEALTKIYFLCYRKMQDFTKHVQKALKQNKSEGLSLLWSISFNMVRFINMGERQLYGQHLSECFESFLRQYKWKNHIERIYILQIIKAINNQQQYNNFTENGNAWLETIEQMRAEQFKTQISIEQEEQKLQVFKYQYEQMKLRRKILKQQQQKKQSNFKSKKAKQELTQQKILELKKKQEELQRQYLNREQVSIFLVVKDQQEQCEVYRIELISEILGMRPYIAKINEDFWNHLALETICQIYERLQTLSISIKTDMLLVKVFFNLLKYQKSLNIIRERIGESIVVRTIGNINKLGLQSPFITQEFSQIPSLLNQTFLEINPKMAQQKITREILINKRIKSIIESSTFGKQDMINGSLMTISCKDKLVIKLPILKQIKSFLLNVKKKKNVPISMLIILVKIMIQSFQSPDFLELNILLLASCLPYLEQQYQYHQKAKTVNQLRILCIQLQNLLIPLISNNSQLHQSEYIPLFIEIFIWYNQIEKHFEQINLYMIETFTILIPRYRELMMSNDEILNCFYEIMTAFMKRIKIKCTDLGLFRFLDCLLMAYSKLSWSLGKFIYSQIPQTVFVDNCIIYQKQARIIFKKQEVEEYLKKKNEEKQKKELQEKKYSIRRNLPGKQQAKGPPTYDPVKQKQNEGYMTIYFGQKEKVYLKELLTNYETWNNIRIQAQMCILQFSLLQTVNSVQKTYYIPTKRPNEFIKNIILEFDEDIYKLFNFLMESESYQLLFLFSSKIYFLCRDYYFVKKLKSFQLLISKCFHILSIFFNKVQILYACSVFCSLFLPYLNSKEQLAAVYNDLNQEDFLIDLFKGADEFVGRQKCYEPWFANILIAYEVTEDMRDDSLLKQSLQSLHKNLVWWQEIEYPINSEIQIQNQMEQSRIMIFKSFKQGYKSTIQQYFKRMLKIVQVQKKHHQFISSL